MDNKKKEKVVILGTAHGKNVAGKRSPDGRLTEYMYSREVVGLLRRDLEGAGLKVYVDMMETEVPMPQSAELRERCAFVNGLCSKYGASNCVYVSVHVNAAGSGKWCTAGGWSAYTSAGDTAADKLASFLYTSAEKWLKRYAAELEAGKESGMYGTNQRAIRRDFSDGDADLEAGFYVLQHTRCAAVLTENLFMDNRRDVQYLLSPEGKRAIVGLHREAILAYMGRR